MDLSSYILNLGIATAFIGGVVQLLKTTFNINKRFVPLVSCLVGLISGLLLKEFTVYSYYTMAFVGFTLGLTTCGLFDVTKVTTLLKKEKK